MIFIKKKKTKKGMTYKLYYYTCIYNFFYVGSMIKQIQNILTNSLYCSTKKKKIILLLITKKK